MQWRVSRRRAAVALAGIGWSAGVACGPDTKSPAGTGPISARELTPQPNLPPLDQRPNSPPVVPGDVQVVEVVVADGQFDADRYSVQTGAVQLRVTARGGPYGMRIDQLLQARTLPANETTALGLTATPGEYTMRLNAGVEDTAVLNVRPVGGR